MAQRARSSVRFPNKLEHQTESLQFVKQLTGVAISNICFLRGLFTNECFKPCYLDTTKVYILDTCDEKKDENFEKLSQLLKYINGALLAVDEGYLKRMVLAFYTDKRKPDTVLETYTFQFEYHADGTPQFRMKSKKGKVFKYRNDSKASRKAVVKILENLHKLTEGMKELPPDVFITMKLYYTDETPADYEPPGFKPGTEGFAFDGVPEGEKPIGFTSGSVDSNFHIVSIHSRSVYAKDPAQEEEPGHQEVPDAEEIQPEEELESMEGENMSPTFNGKNEQGGLTGSSEINKAFDTPASTDSGSRYATPAEDVFGRTVPVRKFGKSKQGKHREHGDAQRVPDTEQNVAAEEEEDCPSEMTIADENEVPGSVRQVTCICGSDVWADIDAMLQCKCCGKWQHGVCYGYPDVCIQPVLQYCAGCVEENPSLKIADAKLQGFFLANQKNMFFLMALYRQGLWALRSCPNWTKITEASYVKTLPGYDEAMAKKLFQRLCAEKILTGRVSKAFNREKWMEKCHKILHLPEDSGSEGCESLIFASNQLSKLSVYSPNRKIRDVTPAAAGVSSRQGKRKVYDGAIVEDPDRARDPPRKVLKASTVSDSRILQISATRSQLDVYGDSPE